MDVEEDVPKEVKIRALYIHLAADFNDHEQIAVKGLHRELGPYAFYIVYKYFIPQKKFPSFLSESTSLSKVSSFKIAPHSQCLLSPFTLSFIQFTPPL